MDGFLILNFSDFGSSTTASTKYSIYADYIPIEIMGNTSIYTSTDTSANRTAVPYTMPETGVINSISIYHNGKSGDILFVARASSPRIRGQDAHDTQRR